MSWLVVVVGLLVAVLAALFANRWEDRGDDTVQPDVTPEDTDSTDFYKGVDRPAGPDAEDPDLEAGGQQ